MRFLPILCYLFFFATTSFAQTDTGANSGTWRFVKYADNIVKITYRPPGYTTNENVSDAVLLKPLRTLQQAGFMQFIAENGKAVKIGQGTPFELVSAFKKDNYNGFQFKLAPGTKVFGGGERALPLNRRGYKFNLYNNPWYGYAEGADNLNYSVPFFTTSDGYGLFFDNASKGYADIGKTDSNIFEVGFVSGEINVYLIAGKDYQQILAAYHKLTGTQPLPPRWALGNLMSRFGYSNQAQVTDIVAKMKAGNIPVDAVIFDLFWFGDSIKGTMGNLDWVNKQKWPDPAGMIKGFRQQNINTLLITEPFVLQSSANYSASKQYHAVDSTGKPFLLTDFYFGKGGLIDIFRKDARNWFWKKYDVQMKIGVEAWWGDLGEPEKHPAGIYHNLKDKGFKRLFTADEVHNIYGHTWTKMLYDNYAKYYPQKRLFSLNRSGFAGSQHYGIFPWSGDVSRSWSGLRAQLPIMLSMSMSGVPYIHADAGGFAGGQDDNELYVRWLQFAAFTPIFRPHGTALYAIDTNAHSFPSEAALVAEPYRSYAAHAINLRYMLLPYNYTLAYKQASSGAPLVAPLYYYYPKDTAAVNVGDEFMWGENILVAPVLEKGLKERKLYLPEGKWYSLIDTTVVDGNVWVNKVLDTVNAIVPKESWQYNACEIPLYVKEGSIIPMWLPVMGAPSYGRYFSTTNYDDKNDIRLVYFPSTTASKSIVYNDDGESKNGSSEIISCEAITKGDQITIKITTNKPEAYRNGMVRRLHIGSNRQYNNLDHGITLNGKKVPDNSIQKSMLSATGKNVFSFVDVEFKGEPVTLQANLFMK